MKKWLVPTAVLASIFAAAAPAAAAPSGPPHPPLQTEYIFHCGQAAGGFDIEATVTGRVKDIVIPGDRVISVAPNLNVTLTNDAGKTVSYVITGASHIQFVPTATDPDSVEFKSTGRNLLSFADTDQAGEDVSGVVLVSGNFNFAVTGDFQTEIRRYSGPGTVIDVCAVLAP